MNESNIQKQIRLELSRDKRFTFWRNNVGSAWTGNNIKKNADGSITIFNPRRITFGLCVGSSDLIGFKKIVITREMVGQTIAQFAAIETKKPRGDISDEQRTFTNHVNNNGGHAIFARSTQDVSELLK